MEESGIGLFKMIQERSTGVNQKFTEKDLELFFGKIEEESKKSRQQYEAREKEIKENIKHLVKRSEELGKEIPLYLYLVSTTNPQIFFVGSDFLEEYKEWL